MSDLCAYNSTVVAGGAVLRRVRWMKGSTFDEVSVLYSQYITKHNKYPTTVVFDGYERRTTKDQEHIQRNADHVEFLIK
jgi:hypothetical protein